MTKKIRLIILGACAVLFLVATPYILLYSLGYKIDFAKRKIVATGGIYVKALPQGVDIIIDAKIKNKTGVIFNSVFVQNLLPAIHNVAIKKDGYFDYTKNLEVKENEVAKLEHVILFKKDTAFDAVDKTQSPFDKQPTKDRFILKNNAVYYADIAENATLSQTQKNTPVVKSVIAYAVSNNRILKLGQDGFLYSLNLSGNGAEKLSRESIVISKKSAYELMPFSQHIFL